MTKQEWKYVFMLLKNIYERDKKLFFSTIIEMFFQVTRPYITIVLMGYLIDMLIDGQPFFAVARVIVLAFIVNLVFGIGESRAKNWFNQKMECTRDLEARDMNHKALEMDYSHLENSDVSTLRFRAFSKSYFGIAGWCLLNIKDFLGGIVSMIVLLGIIGPNLIERSFTSHNLFLVLTTIVFFGIVIAMTFLNYYMGIHYTEEANKVLDSLDHEYTLERYYLDKFSDIEFQKDVRINGWEEMLQKETNEVFQKMQRVTKYHGKLYMIRQLDAGAISSILSIFSYLFVLIQAVYGMITIGSFVSYASSLVNFSKQMVSFTVGLGHLKSVALYAKDYFDFISLEDKMDKGAFPIQEQEIEHAQIDFEHVSFQYPGSKEYIFDDFNLSFKLGNRTAIIGKNGSGKTTFIKLLCRIYDPTAGTILLNGVDIKKYDMKAYQKIFAVVFQDFRIWGFSVGENIAASEEVDEKAVGEALDKVGLEEYIKQLPSGIQSNIDKTWDEDGIHFSGGEKQKMAIGRAIYKDAQVVIMDEPTSALDPISEYETYRGFDELVGDKAAFYISHRLSSCKFCQDIMVFDNGTVVQRGTHQNLITEGGIYGKLWHAQAQYYA